jgi:hypothetical protein
MTFPLIQPLECAAGKLVASFSKNLSKNSDHGFAVRHLLIATYGGHDTGDAGALVSAVNAETSIAVGETMRLRP